MQQDISLTGINYVLEVICPNCRGVPRSDMLPFWTYDEFDECVCDKIVEDDA